MKLLTGADQVADRYLSSGWSKPRPLQKSHFIEMTWGLSLSEISRIRRKRKKIWSIFIGWENHNTQENQTWHWGWSFHCTRPWSSGRSGGSRCICPHPRMLLLFSRLVVSDSLWPMDCSMPGFPVLHHFLELAQTRVHWVGDAIQPSHPLSFPSPPAFNLSQHQDLF